MLGGARRSNLGLVVIGFISGIVITMTALSLGKDGVSRPMLRLLNSDDDMRRHHHHHHHNIHGQNGDESNEEFKVIDLMQQDKHKHAGECLQITVSHFDCD